MSIEPITRLQRFLRVLADSSADMPEPLRNLEKCCCYACGHLDTRPELHTTLEKLIASVRDKSIVPPKPNTRLEKYVAAMAGVWDDELPEPITREDKILFEAASGEDVTLSGNPLMLENCIGGKALKALHVYGKSTQDGTPTPDAPVPIVSAGGSGSVAVKVTGKNLLDFLHETPYIKGWANYNFVVNDDIVTFGTGEGWACAWFNSPVPGERISISLTYRQVDNLTTDTGNAFSIGTTNNYGYPANAELIYHTISPPKTWGKVTCTGVSKQYVYVFMRVNKEGAGERRTIEIKDFQLELGTTATAYEPYREQLITLPTPNGLPGIPVTSGGNYTDPTGQQWVCDEVDLERGVKVQNNGSAQVNTKNGYVGEQYRLDVPIDEEAKDGSFACIISVTPFVTWNSCVAKKNLYLKKIPKTDGSFYTGEELKALALDVDVIYQLATPIETPLTDVEIAAYKSLTTYAPTTVVQAADGAGLEATYKCNVRKAEKTINDLYAELTAELEA